jgi:hypothetical protein
MRLPKSQRSLAIDQVRRRLERWRRTRAYVRAPIPKGIWAAAVALARQQGVYQTARALPVNYGALKQQLEAADRSIGAGAPAGFVELRPTTSAACDDCVIEIDGPRTAVRIRLRGVGLTELARFGRAIAGVDA